MSIMHTHIVYINDQPLRFVSGSMLSEINAANNIHVVSEASFSINEIVDGFSDYPQGKDIIYLCNDPDVSWKNFISLFTFSVAAGGVVKNNEGKLLAIFRRGKWDLPKGKLDYDETPEHAAVREVMEECGLENVLLGELLLITYHTYIEKKKNILKKTHWYAMTTTDEHPLIPQLEEDIEKAEWMTPEQITQQVYANTYRSVKSVLETYLQRR